MKRTPVRKRKDRKVFKSTANKTKAINLSARIRRGGIRM